MSDLVGAVAVGAIALSWGIGGALSVAILGAVTEPMHAPIRTTLSRVWAWARSTALGGLWAVCWRVLWFASLVRDIAVTYVHTYRADRGTGRHFSGTGRVLQSAGRHRREAWA